jgi:hypothetical protein
VTAGGFTTREILFIVDEALQTRSGRNGHANGKRQLFPAPWLGSVLSNMVFSGRSGR